MNNTNETAQAGVMFSMSVDHELSWGGLASATRTAARMPSAAGASEPTITTGRPHAGKLEGSSPSRWRNGLRENIAGKTAASPITSCDARPSPMNPAG